ncbi:MAG: glycosyltransferase family 4 protein [Spirochaetota bacterium]
MKMILYILRLIKRIIKAILPREICEKLRNWFDRNFISRNKKVKLSRRCSTKLPRGVNLFAHCLENSAGVKARLLQQALEAAGIPYHIIDLSNPQISKSELKDKKLYNANIVSCHAASVTPMNILLFGIDLKNHYNIGFWAWELAQLPNTFCSGLNMFQEVWTISGFCTNAIEKKVSVPTLTVPLYAEPNRTVMENGRVHFNIEKDVFLFLFAYDCTSYVSRKNPQAAVQAFLKAFSPEDRHVGLVLKLNYPENYKGHIEELQKILSPYPHVYSIANYLTDYEMRTLVHISDAVVSLHRSEGFGLLPLEAMSLGTPVISTAWSGNMEYMNHMNTALVGYNMIPVNGQYCGSTPGDDLVWADPDIDEAAAHMRRLVSDKSWREKLIANGKYTADECYNVTTVGKIIRNRLEFLKLI